MNFGVKFSSFIHYSKKKFFNYWKKGRFYTFFVVCVHKNARFRARKPNNALTRTKKYTCFQRKKRIFVS